MRGGGGGGGRSVAIWFRGDNDMGRRPHHGEGAPTNSAGNTHVGCTVAG